MDRVLVMSVTLMTAVISAKPPQPTGDTAFKKWASQYMQSLYDAQSRKIFGPSIISDQWKNNLEFEWPCSYVQEFYEERGLYDPGASILSGVDVYKNEIYATVFRTSELVPAGLNIVVKKDGKSLLKPYPSLKMNELYNCYNLQSPSSTIIDPNTGYMYVIDTGSFSVSPIPPEAKSQTESRTQSFTAAQACPPKLVVIDINNNGKVIRSHNLNSVVPNTNYIHDIALDYGEINGKQVQNVLIADGRNSRMCVFNLITNNSWYFEHESMQYEEGEHQKLNGSEYNILSITIDAEAEYVYYTALGKSISQVPASVLRDPKGNFAGRHRYIGNTISQSNRVVCGKKGLYFTAANTNEVYRWKIYQDMQSQNVSKEAVIMQSQTQVMNDTMRDYWIDRLRMGDGYLWFSVRALTRNEIESKGNNFNIHKVYVGDKSSLFWDN